MKNKAPAEVQITAEQLLREAKERELELLPPPPKQKITDQEELNDYKLRKRKVSASIIFSLLVVFTLLLLIQPFLQIFFFTTFIYVLKSQHKIFEVCCSLALLLL